MFASRLPLPKMLAAASFGLAALTLSTAASAQTAYAVTPLVSDGAVSAHFNDPNLKNPWGIAFNPNGFVWVANNHTGTSTLYDGNGMPQTLVVAVPGAEPGPGKPIGIVFSSGSGFVVTKNGLSGAARFIFASEDGTIAGWAPNVDQTNAIIAAPAAGGASYKGLALAANGQGNFLYATDFHNAKIDVFDSTYQHVSWPGAFTDPNLPAGYSPFGIQNLQGNLYVTYAKQDAAGEDEVTGRGLGLVNVYDASGKFIRRAATGGRLNAPWGVAMAPADFGKFSNALLVGNFGDGRITAYDPRSGMMLGQLRGADGRRLALSGLWGMAFGNGLSAQPTGTLFFAAGTNDEANGLYGRIDVQASTAVRDRDDDGDKD
jgi:uncharacterized protein (TIGR03118 family)